MNRYHRYQNVNSYWYDEVPDHWKKTKNKYVFHQDKKVVGSSWEDHVLLTMGKSGVKPRDMEGGGKFPASFENYQVVTPNQIIFCLFDLDETPRTVGKSSDHGMITSAYDVFSTTPENDPQFWTYFYQMIDDHKGLRPYYTGLRKVVRSETFMGIEVFSPPIEEQKLISRYLHKKTGQIDLLVEKIQKKIELLKEQRTSLISHYVTKGLDPNVEMKDSGIEWIGEIPKNWSVRRLKYHLTPREERSQDGTEELLSVTINPGVIRRRDYLGNDEDHISRAESLVGYKVVKKNDLVNNIMKMSFCCLGISDFDGIVSPAYSVFSLDEEILVPRYLHELLRTPSYIAEYRRRSKGIQESRMRLYDDYFLDISIAVPPKEEQVLILEKIIKSESSSIFEKENSRLLLLKEYRQSLISSVVTGKVRVTEDMI